ncbi:hypothetical protein [Bosea sp. (in: a-proteobacteria)]|uniref:hypothetical protein n=1 Tax=Bosea sp. (in: a-proteobacteria) TaxID=1871050 RepID=UPI00261B4B23|nr:hypothetical protein [Bosea sp. (in: a-proteobacteria)]MCO5091412.1 hypothetical protein [Bosea sp. (in: a-proteobacteria)]
MAEAASRTERTTGSPDASLLVLLQAAAARAEIGSFARCGRASPQAAAGSYRAAARLTVAAGHGRLQAGRG